MKLIYKLLFPVIFLLLITSCARIGRPDGGPKDDKAPLMVKADPPYKSTNFKETKIKIYFNEYIRLKDLQKQLVVSPPLKNPPVITPQGSPSKSITIKILDTLQPNTTYTFNFGNAVQDNNENNKLESFKYVFSTGSYVDSLTLKGSLQNALEKETDKNVNLLLYKIDENFKDSIIYKQKPKYVTSSLDTTNFKFTNLQKGDYLLVALKETFNDYLFNPKTDKIGVYTSKITLPKDSILTKPIRIFKEIQPYVFRRGKEVSKGKILFSYQGIIKDLKIKVLSDVPADFKQIIKLEKDKDTINYWHTPIQADSLNFVVYNQSFSDTTTVRLRKKKVDSLTFESSVRGILSLRDTLFLESNNPITNVNSEKINFLDKDSTAVAFKSIISSKENTIALLFDKKPSQNYNLQILPNALTDIYQQKNDTLQYDFKTKTEEDYGKIIATVNNATSLPVIIELLTKDGKIIARKQTNKSEQIQFTLLEPNQYVIRAIIDSNKNGKWDTGNYLQKIQPEKIIYHPEVLKLRANWDANTTITINN